MQIIGTRLSQIIIMKPDKSILAQLTILGNFEYISNNLSHETCKYFGLQEWILNYKVGIN